MKPKASNALRLAKSLAATRAYQARYPERLKASARKSALKRKFGMSRQDYIDMLDGQGGVCAICHISPEENGRELAVDHNHKTHRIRGLLCINCNKLLGHAKEKPRTLEAAISYLGGHV